jgi:hypothetical protein
VRKIDHADDTENHGQAESHQAVDKARQDAAHGNVDVDVSRHNAPAAQTPAAGTAAGAK